MIFFVKLEFGTISDKNPTIFQMAMDDQQDFLIITKTI